MLGQRDKMVGKMLALHTTDPGLIPHTKSSHLSTAKSDP